MEPLPVWSPPQQQHIASCVGGAGNERYNVLTEYGTDLFTQGEDPGKQADAFNKYGSQLNPMQVSCTNSGKIIIKRSILQTWLFSK